MSAWNVADHGALLQKLIDLPGAGEAEKRLRTLGLWDDSKDPDMIEFDVVVQGMWAYDHDYDYDARRASRDEIPYGSVTVYARDQEHAKEKVYLMNLHEIDWDVDEDDLDDEFEIDQINQVS